MNEQVLGPNNQEPRTNNAVFAQPGATVAPTTDGFTVTVTARLPGKPQRIEVEIPWPDGLAFDEDDFMSVEYRLRKQ